MAIEITKEKVAGLSVLVFFVVMVYLYYAAGTTPADPLESYHSPFPPRENFSQTSSVTCGADQRLAKRRDEFGNIVFDCVNKMEGFRRF